MGGCRTRECQRCGQPCDASIPCTGCGAFFFCSASHRASFCADEGAHACSRVAAQMSRGPLLASFPFTFAPAATSAGDSECELLRGLGLHRIGIWRRECPCLRRTPCGLLGDDAGPSGVETWSLGGGDEAAPIPSCWEEAYEGLGIPLSDPVGRPLMELRSLWAATGSQPRASLISIPSVPSPIPCPIPLGRPGLVRTPHRAAMRGPPRRAPPGAAS